MAKTTLRTEIRKRADIVGDTVRHTDTHLDSYIEDSAAQLQGILLQKNLILRTHTQSITATGATSYAGPTDYFSTIGVFRQDDNETHFPLRLANNLDFPTDASSTEGEAVSYRLFVEGDTGDGNVDTLRIQFYPEPQSGTYLFVYVPRIDLDSNAFIDHQTVMLHEWIVSDVCRKVYRRDNLDARPFVQDREVALQRIEDYLASQEMHQTNTVLDVRPTLIDAADFRWPRDPKYRW